MWPFKKPKGVIDVVGATKPKSASLRAVVTRADGTVEDLGVVAYYHRNPIYMLGWHIYRLFKRCRTYIRSKYHGSI
jgi:hypothetical protein